MATYINLVNELLRRLNEVPINESDFSAVRNVQGLAKDSINSSVREMLQEVQEWPFTLVTYEQTLIAGVSTYSFPSNYSSADWETFYLNKLVDNTPKRLNLITYDTYIDKYRPNEDSDSSHTVPQLVYMTQDSKFGVTPVPDDSYVVEYRYWLYPEDMINADDVCVVPDRFKHVLIDGAMIYIMRFRSNDQQAAMHQQKFSEGIKTMRRLTMDIKPSVTSTIIQRNISGSIISSAL
jgi:hypothetical protein